MGNFKLLLISACQFTIKSSMFVKCVRAGHSLKLLSDNNINSNNYMLAAPGRREFPTSGSLTSQPSLLDLLVAGNNASLERLRRQLERQPDCGTIVKCDLASLALSYQPGLSRWGPGTIQCWLHHDYFLCFSLMPSIPLEDCRKELSCSLLQWYFRA